MRDPIRPLLRHRCVRPLLLALLWLSAAWLPPAAAAGLHLDGTRPDVDAWPAVSMLSDPEGTLTPAAALQRLHRFETPRTPYANLGKRQDTVWLHLPVQVHANDDGRWVLQIDFPSLDRIDVYVARGGTLQQVATLGDRQPRQGLPWAQRIPATALQLAPGATSAVLLRVHTRSSMIVPLRLSKPEAFHASESFTLALQGVATGIGLCLLMYALANWVGSRERMFLYYAAQITFTTLFFLGLYGLGAQYLWPDHAWLVDNSTPLTVLLALAPGLMLLERMLDLRALHARLADAVSALAALCVAIAAGFALGWLDYGTAQAAARLLGPVPMLLAVPTAALRWRQGDRAARYVLAGWAVYAVGAIVLTTLLRGMLDWNAWTQYAAQVASIFEMGMWLHVLGLRHAQAEAVAQRAVREHEAMERLAHTDALTGLPNRRGLQQRLAQALAASRQQHLLAVFLLDLDGFKPVNDRHGHDVGDALLIAVGQRLQSQLRATDVVARLGGDEFVVLAAGLPDENAAAVLGRKLLAAFEAPFDAAGKRCEVGLTAGYALAPLDGTTADALIKCADAAMYAGKQAGRRRVGRGVATAAATA